MLQSSKVTTAITQSLQSIPELAAELGAPLIPATSSIIAHQFLSGEENSLNRAVASMASPSMIVAYVDRMQGNYDGMTQWRHRISFYARARNASAQGSALSAPDILNLALNYPISVPYAAPNIRSVDLLNCSMWLYGDVDTHAVDELGSDMWVATTTWSEYGDVGPDGGDPLCMGAATSRRQLRIERDRVISLLDDDEDRERLTQKVMMAFQLLMEEEK